MRPVLGSAAVLQEVHRHRCLGQLAFHECGSDDDDNAPLAPFLSAVERTLPRCVAGAVPEEA
jgi:hypothetical protein